LSLLDDFIRPQTRTIDMSDKKSDQVRHQPVVDEPPGKDGYQGQSHPKEQFPVPDYAPGTNPPGTNPPVPSQVDPATHPVPGSVPGQIPPYDDAPAQNVPQQSRNAPREAPRDTNTKK
jgi:hypothetical protein